LIRYSQTHSKLLWRINKYWFIHCNFDSRQHGM